MKRTIIGLAAAAPLSVAGFALADSPRYPPGSTAASAQHIVVTQSVQAEIDAYIRDSLVVSHYWSLAIAKDGSRVASATCALLADPAASGPCSDVQALMQDLANREAVRLCGGPDECVLLYEHYTKVPDIEIVAP